MSYYNTPYYTIYDLIDSLNQRPQLPRRPQQFPYPAYPRSYSRVQPQPLQQQQQPYYYYNGGSDEPEDDYPEDEDEEQVPQEGEREHEEEDEDPRDILYRSLYGDGPYAPHASSSSFARPSRPVQAQQRPQIRRQPSLPRPPHPAQSVVDLLNSLGVNVNYPDQIELPTRRTLRHESPIESTPEEDADTTSEPAVVKGVDEQPQSESEPKKQESASTPSSFKKPAAVRRRSTLNLHASAPSPVLDPLQVSKPQLSKNLPFSPPINVYDKPDSYIVVVSIPGSDRNSFHVDFHPTSHELIVKGEIKNKYHDQDAGTDQFLKVSEQRFGSFERNIRFPTLPKIADDDIKALYNNGLLEISIPKIVKAQDHRVKRRIEIEEVEDEELKREAQGGI